MSTVHATLFYDYNRAYMDVANPLSL